MPTYVYLPDALGVALWNLDATLPRVTTPDEVCHYVSDRHYFPFRSNIVETILRLQLNRSLALFLKNIETKHDLKAWHWQRILRTRIQREDCIRREETMERRHLLAIRGATRLFIRHKARLVAWLRPRMRRWHARVILPRQKTGHIIARNLVDRIYEIHYDEKKHPFWSSAFSDAFGGGKDAEGRLIMDVNEIGTSQEAIGAYCEHMRDSCRGLLIMDAVFYDACRRSSKEGSEALDHMATIGRLWDNPEFAMAADSMLSDYIDATLYRTEISKDQRLEMFVTVDKLKARAAWEGIFDSSDKRQALAANLDMPAKRWGAFRRCETVDALVAYLQMLRRSKNNQELPSSLQERFEQATKQYESALRGSRVGQFGWYWDSEEIDMATSQLQTVNKEVREWKAKNISISTRNDD